MIIEDRFYVTLALMTNFLVAGTLTGSYRFRLLKWPAMEIVANYLCDLRVR